MAQSSPSGCLLLRAIPWAHSNRHNMFVLIAIQRAPVLLCIWLLAHSAEPSKVHGQRPRLSPRSCTIAKYHGRTWHQEQATLHEWFHSGSYYFPRMLDNCLLVRAVPLYPAQDIAVSLRAQCLVHSGALANASAKALAQHSARWATS